MSAFTTISLGNEELIANYFTCSSDNILWIAPPEKPKNKELKVFL